MTRHATPPRRHGNGGTRGRCEVVDTRLTGVAAGGGVRMVSIATLQTEAALSTDTLPIRAATPHRYHANGNRRKRGLHAAYPFIEEKTCHT